MATTTRQTKAKTEESDGALPPEATVHQRMVRILAELPAIGKSQRNEQQKFMYRGHDDVLNALNPLLAEHGVYIVPRVLERIAPEPRQTRSGSLLYEIDLHIEFTFYGLAGDKVVASAWGEGTDSGDKSTNKATTMAFKNVLAQTFAISTAETQDADATSPAETVGRGQQQQRQQQRTSWKDIGERALHLLDQPSWWGDWIGSAATRFGVEFIPGRKLSEVVAAMDERKRGEFGLKLANTLEYLATDIMGGRDFPPAEIMEVAQAFAWGFDGLSITSPPQEQGSGPGNAPGSAESDGEGSPKGKSQGGDSEQEKPGESPDANDTVPEGFEGVDFPDAR